jgi:23S rRNA (guanosine2251-2'-O)-methyltransferase
LRTPRPGRPGGASTGSRAPKRQSRDRPGVELLYGRNAVAEALRGRRRPRALLLAEGIKEDERIHHLLAAAKLAGVPTTRLSRPDLDHLLGRVNHQGVALEVGPYPYVAVDQVLSTSGTILALDHLQDPQNVGTLLRAAAAAGVASVLIPSDRAADITPSVVNTSAGAVEHLPIARVPNLARTLDTAKDAGWWVAGLDEGDQSLDLFTTDLPTPIALVVGSEGAGIGQNVRKRCDLFLSIPMTGRVASLNAATAGAIALFELLRRQRMTSP